VGEGYRECCCRQVVSSEEGKEDKMSDKEGGSLGEGGEIEEGERVSTGS